MSWDIPYRVKRPKQEFPPGKKNRHAFLPFQALSAKQGVNYGGIFLVDNHFGVGVGVFSPWVSLVGRDRDGVLGLD